MCLKEEEEEEKTKYTTSCCDENAHKFKVFLLISSSSHSRHRFFSNEILSKEREKYTRNLGKL